MLLQGRRPQQSGASIAAIRKQLRSERQLSSAIENLSWTAWPSDGHDCGELGCGDVGRRLAEGDSRRDREAGFGTRRQGMFAAEFATDFGVTGRNRTLAVRRRADVVGVGRMHLTGPRLDGLASNPWTGAGGYRAGSPGMGGRGSLPWLAATVRLRSTCVQIRHFGPDHRSLKSLGFLVGVAGFEPATPASRTRYTFSK